jgi:hypothetical protein
VKHCTCNSLPDVGRRSFFASAASAVAAVGVVATSAMAAEPVRAQPAPQGGQRKFMEEAARLAIESVEKGWGGRLARSSPRMARSSAAARTACC